MRTKDRVRRYRERHPASTVREIQIALGISSPSVVQFHLANSTKQDALEVLRKENKVLRAKVKELTILLDSRTR